VKAKPIRGLYAITPELESDLALFDKVEQALGGGAALLQYRDKHSEPKQLRMRAKRLRQLCHRYQVPFIINDDPQLASEVKADGVHLGRDDASVETARALLGIGAIIGVSCYDELARARDAQAEGADYVAFGSVFASSVKQGAVHASLDLIRQAREEIRIDLGNALQVIRAGAHAIAVITALFSAPDVRGQASAFAHLFPPIE
jgi:thiamine-phosphate pyrophosphorylase